MIRLNQNYHIKNQSSPQQIKPNITQPSTVNLILTLLSTNIKNQSLKIKTILLNNHPSFQPDTHLAWWFNWFNYISQNPWVCSSSGTCSQKLWCFLCLRLNRENVHVCFWHINSEQNHRHPEDMSQSKVDEMDISSITIAYKQETCIHTKNSDA